MTVSEDDDYDPLEAYAQDHEDRLPAKAGCSLEKLASRINLDDDYCTAMSGPKLDKNRGQKADKANRAVTEQVLDARTRMILLKMINNGLVYEINGCISTGKEANVYHAVTEAGVHRAIKIYKSTILTFKSRDKYVSGEFRFKGGYCKTNPRKMVQVWAEKEMRNLKRLNQAGIPSPAPVLLKLHVLVMEFIGDRKGIPAPRLKDAAVPADVLPKLYAQLLRIVRTLFQDCCLVHADLSEYNLLYLDEAVVVIDVSQAVEREHPNALDFLRQDCTNVLHYFRQRGLQTLGLQQLFDFATDASIADPDAWLEAAHQAAASDELDTDQHAADAIRNAMTEESVFRNTFIPRSIEQVRNIERLVANRERGGDDDVYTKLTGLVLDEAPAGSGTASDTDGTDSDSGSGSDTGTGSDSDSDSDAREFEATPGIDREARRALRKENKKLVKEENKQKRKTKMKKHVKKRKEKQSQARK